MGDAPTFNRRVVGGEAAWHAGALIQPKSTLLLFSSFPGRLHPVPQSIWHCNMHVGYTEKQLS